jgi:hypothetical protein
VSAGEQPPAAPDEPVTTVHEPTFAGPVPPGAPPPPSDSSSASPPRGGEFLEKHPEALVGAAFAGGALFAIVLKSLGRR